jgi:hypothetical protein
MGDSLVGRTMGGGRSKQSWGETNGTGEMKRGPGKRIEDGKVKA